MLLQGRVGGWQLIASSSLSKLFIDLAALHPLLSTPDCGLCLSGTPMSHFLSQFKDVFVWESTPAVPPDALYGPSCQIMTGSVTLILRGAANIHPQLPETKHSLNTRHEHKVVIPGDKSYLPGLIITPNVILPLKPETALRENLNDFSDKLSKSCPALPCPALEQSLAVPRGRCWSSHRAFNAWVAAWRELCHWCQRFPLTPPPVFAGAWQEAASFAWDLCSLASSVHTIAERHDRGGPSSRLQTGNSLRACPVHHAHLRPLPPCHCSVRVRARGGCLASSAALLHGWWLWCEGGGFAQRQGTGLRLFGACVLNGGPSF